MGAYLNKPITEKESESGEGNGLKYGATSMQGWRVNQEIKLWFSLGCAQLRHWFTWYMEEFWTAEDIVTALQNIFIDFDDVLRSEVVLNELKVRIYEIINHLYYINDVLCFQEILLPGDETPGEDSGTTACLCLLNNEKIVVANAGDSRAVLCREGKALDLSIDHKPEDEVEKMRIEKAGGMVNGDGRALPDVKVELIQPGDEFIVVACDGIWNSMESQQVIDFVRERISKGKSCEEISGEMMESLSAIQSLAELQTKFQPDQSVFDTECMLSMTRESSEVSGIALSIFYNITYHFTLIPFLSFILSFCLVYDLFLKNMVGGLHTVYTKLKRLEITPIICNVEQVRALRSMSAIQPGVNRCKLIATSDFDRLYEDCTNTCTRPGRPPKRTSANDEWTPKREKYEDIPNIEDFSLAPSPTPLANPLLLGQFLPQFTAQQLLMQHMMAVAVMNKPMELRYANKMEVH
uniref:PPM-type phosphatase domain-containing protein n=1 Tax=Heterorhabditis bacteriophora TaxID=37862 RepID=A0A1I7XK28_HETBA